MKKVIPPDTYCVLCEDVKYHKNSNTVSLFFNIENIPVKKIIKCENENHKDFLLGLYGKQFWLDITNYITAKGKEHRITYVKVKTGDEIKEIYSKNKTSVGKKKNQEKTIPNILLDIERVILDNEDVRVPKFLYEDLSQFDIVNKFFSDYDNYVKIFCSKYGFISRTNALGNKEYIIDVPLCKKLFSISKNRMMAKCERFDITSDYDKERILRSEVQGVIGEETMVKFFNSLWSFLSINKEICVNDSIYDSSGDTGVDFQVGVFDIDAKQRNRSPNADLLLNKETIEEKTLILLITCLKSHKDSYYIDLYNTYSSDKKFIHQSVMTGYTDSTNYNKYCHIWNMAKKRKKYSLDYYRILSMDKFIKLMIIEALKEEI